MHTPKLGIIGCGAAAKRYYVPALRRHNGVIGQLQLVDKNKVHAEALCQELGGGTIHTDYNEILGKVDGAIILLPHFLHFQVAEKFLKAGIPVLCEKPLAESQKEVKILNDLTIKTGVALCVNNTRRMFPSFREVKRLIDSGAIGRVQSIYYQEGATFAWPSATGFYANPAISDKGVLLDVGAHVLDMICCWLGEKPKVEEVLDDSFGGPESVIKILLTSPNCRCEVFLNRLADIDSYFRIKGSHGSIEGRLFDWNKITVTNAKGGTKIVKIAPRVNAYPDFVLPIVDNFINVLKKKEPPLVSGNDVHPSIELLEECYKQRTRFHLPWYDIKESQKRKAGRVLITGATGFIGARIVEHLHLSQEYEVRASIHKWSSAARLGRFPVDIDLTDLKDYQQVEKGLEGITHIIHCAKGPGGVTEEGTRNLLEAALKKGIERFIHLSTTEVYGNVTGEIYEDSPFHYTGNEYNRSKIEAEKVCWEYHKKGLPLVVLRPSIVYGPFSGNWTLHYARMLLEGLWGEYEKFGEGTCNLIYVDDLLRAAVLALGHEAVVGEAFNLNGPDTLTWNEYFRCFNQALGLPPIPKIKASKASLKTTMILPVRVAGKIVKNHFLGPVKKIADNFALAKKILKFTEHTLKTTPASTDLKLFNRKAIFSPSKAEQLLYFSPTTSLEEGLTITVTWLKHQRIARQD